MHSSSNPLIPANSAIVSGISKLPEVPSAPGVDLEELPVGAVLEIETGHNTYRLENKGQGLAMLSGHPKYCPQPTTVLIQGSFSADGEMRWHFLGAGGRMVFLPPDHGVVRTSSIKSVRQVSGQGSN